MNIPRFAPGAKIVDAAPSGRTKLLSALPLSMGLLLLSAFVCLVGAWSQSHSLAAVPAAISGVALESSLRFNSDLTNSTLTNPTATNNDEEVVYLDTNGFLRIWNPQPVADAPALGWVSPLGGWRDFALADFNLDGDMEIVAVGGESDSGRIVIYDPVLTDRSAINAERITNDIPWDILYEDALPGRPLLIETGELTPTIPGPELAIVFSLNPADRIDPDDETRLLLWQADLTETDGTPTGRAWESSVASVDFGNTWERLEVGDLDADGRAEIALVDDGVGLLRIYRLESGFPIKIYENESGERPWQDVTIAQFIPSSIQQIALARASNFGGSTFWVLYYNPAEESLFGDSYTELLLPTPRVIFHGDINGNGDDEIFLLRQVPSTQARVRLIMRNAGDDTLPVFEHTLDNDNGYRAGAAGDSDGDGRAEVLVMRDNRLRIYTAPESDVNAFTEFSPPAVTNGRTVHFGNLDANGYLALPQLGAIPPLRLDDSLAAGEQKTTRTLTVDNTNDNSDASFTFTVEIAGEPDWLTITPRSGTSGDELSVTFDARYLPPGTYRTEITIKTADPVVRNMPLVIASTLVVNPSLAPTAYAFAAPYDCAAPATRSPYTATIPLTGPDNLAFSAQILDVGTTMAATRDTLNAPLQAAAVAAPEVTWPSEVPWVAASSSNVLPASMDIVFTPTALATPGETAEALLEIAFFDNGGRRNTRAIDLSLYCARNTLYLPLVAR